MIGFRCSVFGVLFSYYFLDWGDGHTTLTSSHSWRRIAKHYLSDHLFFGDADYRKAIRYFQQQFRESDQS